MVKVSCVSYLNSAPFVYGLQRMAAPEMELSLDIPSVCASRLISGDADLGLVPVAVIPQIPNARIVSDFCIGADGPVRSVTLVSDVPLDQIQTILLDYQSRTSVALTRVLASRLWNIDPRWDPAVPGYESEIKGATAGVVIGDRSLRMRDRFKYVYDLSGEWKKLTGLPFVFACWVSNRELPAGFTEKFNAALQNGMNAMDSVISGLDHSLTEGIDVETYLRHDISYHLDDSKRKALDLFSGYLEEIPAPASSY